MDNPNVVNLSDSIDTTINNVNKFYALIDEVKNSEEKLNSKLYISFLGYYLCCFKKEYRNNNYINSKINKLESKKKEINNKLIEIRNKYMSKNNADTIKIYSKISIKIIMFLFVSIFHFLAMTEVEGILYPIFGEIKKVITFKFTEKYDTNKTFYDFLEESTLNDTAQINFSYFFSFLCPYFIKNNRLYRTYIISIIIIFIFFNITLTVDFLNKDKIKQNVNFSNGLLSLLIFIYIMIYIFTSLISLIPFKILMKDKNYSCLHILLTSMALTIGVIIKNLIHFYFKISSIFVCSMIFLFASLFFLICCKLINYFSQNDKINNDKIINNPIHEENNNKEMEMNLNFESGNDNSLYNINNDIDINIIGNDKIKDTDNIISDDSINKSIKNNEEIFDLDNDKQNILKNKNDDISKELEYNIPNNLINEDNNRINLDIDNNENENKENNLINSSKEYELIKFEDLSSTFTTTLEEITNHNINLILKRKNFYTSDYYFGYLMISFDEFVFFIKIKSFLGFLKSLINSKFIFIFFVNLLSRAQKLKFKEEYKKEFDGCIISHILNFLLSYFISYLFIGFCFWFNRNKIDENLNLKQKDKLIISSMIIDSLFMMLFSFINRFASSSVITFFAISISGNINFLFYEYYSTQQVEYTSLSGFIAIGQVIFRSLELLMTFKELWWYYIQYGISLIVSILCGIYVYKDYMKIIIF